MQHSAHGQDVRAPDGPRIPRPPVRQQVLLAPKRLRHLTYRDGASLNVVQRIFLRVTAQSLQTHCFGATTAGQYDATES